MDYININKLLDDLDKLASELRENKLKCHYNSQENHVATVRNAQSALITLQSELRNKWFALGATFPEFPVQPNTTLFTGVEQLHLWLTKDFDMKLYHGSAIDIEKTLKPHRAFHRRDYTPQVYLTDEIERALLYAINPIEVFIKNKFKKDINCSATSAHFFDIKKPITLIEIYPNMFKETYLNKKAYIYVCDIDSDKVHDEGGNQFTIDHEIDFSKKIEIDNVYSEILSFQKQGKLKLLGFNDIDFEKTYFEREHLIDSLCVRKNYCKTPQEESFFVMMKKHFPIG